MGEDKKIHEHQLNVSLRAKNVVIKFQGVSDVDISAIRRTNNNIIHL